MVKEEKVYVICNHSYHFRCGIPAELQGLVWIDPYENGNFRTCYHLKWADGVEDYTPTSETHFIEFIRFNEYLKYLETKSFENSWGKL